jgi:hypothetical protein
MSPEMYALIDPNPFHLNIPTQTTTPDYPERLVTSGDIIPYHARTEVKNRRRILMREELL